MNRTLIIVCLVAFSLNCHAAKPKGFLFALQGGYGLLHASDVDWRGLFWGRPSVQADVAWGKFNLRGRHLNFGKFGKHLGSSLYGEWENTRVGSETERLYTLDDIILSYNFLPTNKHRLLVGIGATHCKGEEGYAKYVFNKGSWTEVIGYFRYRDEWGGIVEASYDRSLWKYLMAGVHVGYRIYPNVDAILYTSITFGLKIGR